MAVNYLGGVSPAARERGPLVAATAGAVEGMTAAMARLDYAGGLAAVWDLIRAANSFIEEREPWKLHKAGEADAVAAVLGDCLEALRVVAILASPVLTRASAELWRRLGLDGSPSDQRLPDAAAWTGAPAGRPLEKGDALFPRLELPAAQ
jgi:methionyl-tRNA synthetase